MADAPTQSQITRCVKAAIKGAHDMGYRVAAYEVVFSQGVPTVRVTTGPESPPQSPPVKGGLNVETLAEGIRNRVASKRS